MYAYDLSYLNEIVETQGKLFEEVQEYEPGIQWYYNIASKRVIELVPLDFIRVAYNGLHDLELDLAVRKVGEQVGMQ